MSRKVIFFDIDGTIITADGNIPDSAVNAICRARENGHICVVNTGRPFSHIDPKVIAIGFDGYICSCGQRIIYNCESVFRDGLTAELCGKIVKLCRDCGVVPIYEDEEGIWYDPKCPECEVVRLTREQFVDRTVHLRCDIDREDFRFDKFCVWYFEESNTAAFRRFIEKYCTVIEREGNMLELVKLGYSKQTGIQRLIDYVKTEPENCYAIGDSTNDLPMLCAVGHSIAMGNAPDAVKSVVEYTTDSINDDGLANALKHYGFI